MLILNTIKILMVEKVDQFISITIGWGLFGK